MHAGTLKKCECTGRSSLTSVYATLGKLYTVKICSAEDWLLRNGQLIQLMRLGPCTVVHVWQRTSSSVSHGTAKRMVVHLVVRDVSSWVLDGSLRWWHQQCVHATDWTVGRLSLVQEIGWRQLS